MLNRGTENHFIVHQNNMFYVQQLYTSCLAQAAYYIESKGEAIIIDPIRETQPYLDLLKSRHARLSYILETHFHADFVSGHLDLAKATGATIVYGPETQTGYPVKVAIDQEELTLGDVRIRVLHTPGHTPESTCYLLLDETGNAHSLFTGDTLFVGDVGRPDLLDGVMSKEELAGMMYDSIQRYVLPLPDEVLVYPGHGPGSACGKSIGKETQSTIGEQRKNNYALQPMTREKFILTLTEGISPAPAYFFEDARINKQGYGPVADVMKKGMIAKNVEEVKKHLKDGGWILDSRQGLDFGEGFIPGSLNIGLDGQFAIWAGTLLPLNAEIILVTELGKEEESLQRLARVGFHQVIGYLEGGFESWKNAGEKTDMVITIEPEELALDYEFEALSILDVRRKGEFETAHVDKAQWLPLDQISASCPELDKKEDYYVHCAAGYRSMVAASWLKRAGISNVKNVSGGFQAISQKSIPIKKS